MKKGKIWFLAQEKLESRYTIDWYNQFPKVWKEMDRKFEIIDGKRQAKEINRKLFLDPVGTNKWKLSQLEKVLDRIDEVDDSDSVFIPDGWFPGVETLFYVRSMLDKKFNVVAYWHAGTWDKNDLISQKGFSEWANGLEESWLTSYDMNLVATDFHKKLIQDKYDIPDSKFSVVGFPLDIEGISKRYRTNERSKDIMFTGRLSKEKGLDTIERLKKLGYNVTVLSELGLNREGYYKELAKGKVVIAPSYQETFGIGILEGAALGLLPVAPDKLSFQETLSEEFRYKNDDKLLEMINKGLKEKQSEPDLEKYQYQKVINRITDYL